MNELTDAEVELFIKNMSKNLGLPEEQIRKNINQITSDATTLMKLLVETLEEMINTAPEGLKVSIYLTIMCHFFRKLHLQYDMKKEELFSFEINTITKNSDITIIGEKR